MKMLLLMLCLFMLFGTTAQAKQEIPPLGQIRLTVDNILTVLRDETLKSPDKNQERREKILIEVDKRFDFEEMTRLALGSEWDKRNKKEQEEFIDLFKKILENRYIGRVEAYSDEQVNFQDELIKGNKALVSSVFSKNGQEMSVDYKLKKNSDNWLVYDVIIEKVSLIKNYRAEFAQIIAKEEYAGLLKRLKGKVEQISE